LREKRRELSAEVTEVINTLGPEMFPDFDSARIIADPFRSGMFEEPRTPRTPRTPSRLSRRSTTEDDSLTDASIAGSASTPGQLPRNESFGNLGNIGLFASRPQTPQSHGHSRSGSQAGVGFGMQGFSMLSSKESLDEVSKKIRGAMRERGQRRRKSEEGSGFAMTPEGGSGTATPGEGVQEGRKDV
ncbi:MAG: hypothetical protein L6R41_008121, partial [Letrouitia leprolyta]